MRVGLVAVLALSALSGCSGSSYGVGYGTSYYGGYYDNYPYGYYGGYDRYDSRKNYYRREYARNNRPGHIGRPSRPVSGGRVGGRR